MIANPDIFYDRTLDIKFENDHWLRWSATLQLGVVCNRRDAADCGIADQFYLRSRDRGDAEASSLLGTGAVSPRDHVLVRVPVDFRP